jgi:hypothetical protein
LKKKLFECGSAIGKFFSRTNIDIKEETQFLTNYFRRQKAKRLLGPERIKPDSAGENLSDSYSING